MGNRDDRVYAQIEGTADLYEPSVYSLLPLFQDFQREVDSRSEDYLPLTSAIAPYSANHKIFVIGLFPPSVTVTGRLIDRSASVAAITGQSYDALDIDIFNNPFTSKGQATAGSVQVGIVSASGYQIGPGGGSSNPGVPAGGPGSTCTGGVIAAEYAGPGKMTYAPCMANISTPEKYQLLHDAYVRIFGKEPTPTEIQIYAAQSIKETSGNTPGNNFGYMGNYGTPNDNSFGYKYAPTKDHPDGRVEYYNSYPTKEAGAEAYIKQVTRNPNAVRAAQGGDVLGYITAQAQAGYYGATVRQYYASWPGILNQIAGSVNSASGGKTHLQGGSGLPKDAPNTCAFNESIQQYQARNTNAKGTAAWRFNDLSRYGDQCQLFASNPGTAEPTTAWNESGSDNAQTASKANDKLSYTDLNKTALGEAFQAAQKRMINATLEAMDRIRNTPPLKLLVNPTSFKVASAKIIADSDRSRSQIIREHWGEEQDKIDASGKLAAFFSSDQSGVNQATGEGVYTDNQTLGAAPGINRTARQYSKSYQNFLGLLQLYKSNGGLWLQDFYEEAIAPGKGNMNLSTVGSVYIYYDNTLYIGSFDTLNVTEADTAPYTLEYSFTFTVRATFLLDQVDEPDSPYNYGAGGLFSPKQAILTRSDTISRDGPPPDPELTAIQEANARSEAVTNQQMLDDQKQKQVTQDALAGDPWAGIKNANEPSNAKKPPEPNAGNNKIATNDQSGIPPAITNAIYGNPGQGKGKKK